MTVISRSLETWQSFICYWKFDSYSEAIGSLTVISKPLEGWQSVLGCWKIDSQIQQQVIVQDRFCINAEYVNNFVFLQQEDIARFFPLRVAPFEQDSST